MRPGAPRARTALYYRAVHAARTGGTRRCTGGVRAVHASTSSHKHRACGIDFGMFPFGKGRPRRPKPIVETTPRIASAPHRGVAREEVRVVVDGVEQRLAIVRQDRIHGQEAFWECPTCARLRWHLYLLNGQIGCRVCLGLDYACRRTRNTVAIRAAKLRRRLGAPAGLLSPLPPRPRNVWAAAYYDRLVRELAVCEAALAQRLGVLVGRRRKRA